MLKQIEGSHAMAETIALCRPEVICAYPITPQTHIVEGLGDMVRDRRSCRIANSSMSNRNSPRCRSRSARPPPARAPIPRPRSQGLLFMAEAVYNASGLGLPIVMTLGNRAIGAPINIWNDHSDAMSMCDAGWMQLFAETNQEAVDLHIQAFRLAEELSMPVMVCVDGFILTHAVERLDIPSQADVDAFLPPYEPVQVLDPSGADLDRRHGRTGRLHRGALPAALQADSGAAADSRICRRVQGRGSAATAAACCAPTAPRTPTCWWSRWARSTAPSRTPSTRCATTVSASASSRWSSFRPFPTEALRELLAGRKNVVVIEKSFAVGMGGQLANNVDLALRNTPAAPQVHSVIAGLGGRPITRASLHRVFRRAEAQPWEGAHFLDLNEDIIGKELHHVRKVRRSGPDRRKPAAPARREPHGGELREPA